MANTKRYRNCGTSPLTLDAGTASERSVSPGEEFTAEFTPEHEAFLNTIEAIREVVIGPAEPFTDDAPAADFEEGD
jgi:hypothetical protein